MQDNSSIADLVRRSREALKQPDAERAESNAIERHSVREEDRDLYDEAIAKGYGVIVVGPGSVIHSCTLLNLVFVRMAVHYNA